MNTNHMSQEYRNINGIASKDKSVVAGNRYLGNAYVIKPTRIILRATASMICLRSGTVLIFQRATNPSMMSNGETMIFRDVISKFAGTRAHVFQSSVKLF